MGALLWPRRRILAAAAVAATLSGCAALAPNTTPAFPPVVFVHGNGDNASIWTTTIWRFESNGWPRDRLLAIQLPYPLARDDDSRPQPGRSSTAEHMAFLKAEVERVRRDTGAAKVVLVANSRGGFAVRNYIQNGGGDAVVSHAVLGGVPNHGVHAIAGYNEGNEFAGTGPFLRGLNAPKNAAGDEVTGPVKWLTIRSTDNDKFAQPEGRWIGLAGKPTGVNHDGPALRGATNLAFPRIDHRETSFSPVAFDATWRFITGLAPRTLDIVPQARPMLSGLVTGLGVSSTDPRTGNMPNNLPLAGATLAIHAIDPATGERRGAPVHQAVIGADGRWGPVAVDPQAFHEFELQAPGYATTHIYRSPFPRSSTVVHLRPERIAEADRTVGALVSFTRPRGYFDPGRDRMALDGSSTLPGVRPGAGDSSARLRLPAAAPRPVVGEFNSERVVGRTWPAAEGHVAVLELHD